MNPIKALIIHEEITQKEFSDKIGVKQQYINKIINGNVGLGASILKKIAVHYPNVNIRWLLGFPGEQMLMDKEGGAIGIASYTAEGIVRYLFENNDRLLENPMFREFVKSNIEVLNIEKAQESLEQKKAKIKATLQEKLEALEANREA
ncbi:MAG: helix-turn-helix transcriptional regulator [Bacteroidota bacterium]